MLLILLSVSFTCMAQDYWVYIRTYDKYALSDADSVGRSKAGDIVDIRPVNPTTYPSEKSQLEWCIIKVSGLIDEDIDKYTRPWLDQDTIKSYRKYKIDIGALNLKIGLDEVVKNFSSIESSISEKTELDLIAYKIKQKWYFVTYPFQIEKAYAIDSTSTINKAGEDFDTLTAWEDAKDGETGQQTAQVFDDQGTLADAVIIDGHTATDYTDNMVVTAIEAERHDGIEGTGVFISKSQGFGQIISASDEFTVIEWVELKNTSGDGDGLDLGTNGSIGRFLLIYENGRNGVVRIGTGCILHNSMVYSNPGIGIVNVFGDVNNVSTYNNGSSGLKRGGFATADVRNVISVGNGGDDFAVDTGGNWGVSNFNLDEDGTAPGATTVTTTQDLTTVFFTSASDLHLRSGADAVDAGEDLGSPFDFDIDNVERTGTWDIGADQFVGAVSDVGQIIMIMN